MSKLPCHIYLCGFMGSGKTTVGSLLAERFSYSFIDTDLMIEQNERKTIRDIFERSGEAAFREMENAMIEEIISSKQNAVVALGGGSLMRFENLSLIRNDGYLVYLNTDLKVIAERLHADNSRPLLIQDSLKTLFDQRRSGYETADLTIQTNDQSPAEIAETIARHLSRLNAK